LTHVWNDTVVARFEHLKHTSGPEFDLRIVLDVSDPEAQTACEADLGAQDYARWVFPFTSPALEQALGYRMYTPGQIVPGSAHFPILAFGKQHVYDAYWVCEFDVLLKTGWREFAGLFESSTADLLCTHLTKRRHSTYWYWWYKCRFPLRYQPRLLWRRMDTPKAFFPIYRLSRKGLEVVDRLHRKGMRAHQEIALPTALWLEHLPIMLRGLWPGAKAPFPCPHSGGDQP